LGGQRGGGDGRQCKRVVVQLNGGETQKKNGTLAAKGTLKNANGVPEKGGDRIGKKKVFKTISPGPNRPICKKGVVGNDKGGLSQKKKNTFCFRKKKPLGLRKEKDKKREMGSALAKLHS